MSATSERDHNTLAALLAEHGVAIGSFAFLVLQHQTDAERILAATLATALRRAELPAEGEATRALLLRLAAREILRGSAQTGEVAPLLPDPRSAADRMSLLEAMAELDPRSRMAIVLHYSLDLDPDAVAAVLDDDPFALRSDLNEARNRLQTRVEELTATEEAPPLGAPSQTARREPFDERLRRVLNEESSRFEPILDPRGVPLPHPSREARRTSRRWWPLAIIALLAAGVAASFWLIPESGSIAGRQAASTQLPTPAPRTAAAPISLADCQIAPAESSLAFAGWTTLAALNVHGGDAGRGQPIYALITRGMAEWVGWQQHYSGPMFPAPIGRMGCIFDPSTRQTSLVGVDAGWEPNLMADGCPPSPMDSFGGYRELGGPRGWLVLLDDTASWHVGDSRYRILVRISPPAERGQSVTAWAQPLADAPRIDGEIGSANSQPARPDNSGSGSRYYLLDIKLPTAGCWVINIAVDGHVVGSAIAPIRPISGEARPRPATTAPGG
jgi:DNA-directed RNA polymerase specialized sigma24 family protein